MKMIKRKIIENKRMRLSVFRSNKFIYAQVIDDAKGVTLAHAMGKDANEVGIKIAEKAIAKKVKRIVFDRRRYKYHGKVRILAQAARQGGLEF